MEVGDSSAGFKRQLCFCAPVLLNAAQDVLKRPQRLSMSL